MSSNISVEILNSTTISPNNGSSTNATNVITYTKDILDWISDFPWPPTAVLTSLLGNLSSGGMIFGAVLPYVPQYIQIHRSKDSFGFSTYVCLALLVANLLRIGFWFGHPFEWPLVAQSILMIVVMLLLLELCVRTRAKSERGMRRQHHFFSTDCRFFWRWTSFTDYLEFLCIFSIVLALVVYLSVTQLANPFYVVETIGYAATGIESMLGLPQFITNYVKKSTCGMSVSMVVMWLSGDLYKTVYFVVNDAPKQFWVCGFTQVTIDLLIMLQIWIYREP